MRHLILALMIVLLPVRGWMGDVMAMESVAATQDATYSIADNHPLTLGYAHSDADSGVVGLRDGPGHCPDHASAHGDGSLDMDNDHAAHDGACTACQVCHTVAMIGDAASMPALPLPALAPVLLFPGFSSALAAPGLKPPIS